MECHSCLEKFNLSERRPKSLPCGHTVCRLCSRRMRKQICPACHKEFSEPVLSLPDNYAVLSLIEKKQLSSASGSSVAVSKTRRRDRKVGTVERVDRGRVPVAPGENPKQASQDLSDLHTTAEQAQRVVDMLQGAAEAVESQLVEWRASLQQVQESERALRQAVEDDTLEEIDLDAFDVDQEQLERLQEAASVVQGGGNMASYVLQLALKDKIGDKWKDGPPPGGPMELLKALVLDIHQQGDIDKEEPQSQQEPDQPKPKPSVPSVQGRIQELDLHNLSQTPSSKRTEKINVLARLRQRGARRLTRVRCDRDPIWVLVVLRSAAPSLEELYLQSPCGEHIQEAHAMPGLRRLELECDTAQDARPPVLPDLPQASLKWLRVVGLPRPTLVSLLRAHSASLDELWLQVGTPGAGKWPSACNDLDGLLAQTGIRAARVVLVRRNTTHGLADCPTQIAAVRALVGSAVVQCTECDKVKWERF